jgi:hypothetical protein
MLRCVLSGLAFLTVFISTPAARADEIRLKDGTKIIGTIVGFESDSFRVETSYGFALIRKDKVADINISASKKDPEPKVKLNGAAEPPIASLPSALPAAAPEITPAIEKESVSGSRTSQGTMFEPKNRAKVLANMVPTAAKSKLEPARTMTAALPPPAPPPAPTAATPVAPPVPPPPPEPLVIRDEIHGTVYANLTYGFQMYKPPSWDLIPEARKALPDAIGAMGTYDQTTLLVIGREHAKDSLEIHAAATGKTLGGVYENYRLISTKRVTLAGSPAIEQRARGTAAGRDWSVVLLTFLRGSDAYTLLGMTWADSDLIQVQENVITKSINSMTFTAQ